MEKRKFLVYITGLPCSGKTTIGLALSHKMGVNQYDGDWVRSKNRDFSREGRIGMIRKVGIMAILNMLENGSSIVSQISPYREQRTEIRQIVEKFGGEFIEVYLSTDVSVCEERDVKGMYKKARNGEIKNFTGIDGVYDPPVYPTITIDTSQVSIEEAVGEICEYANR